MKGSESKDGCRSWARRGKRLLLAVGSLALALVAAEFLFRLFRPQPYRAPTLIKSDGTVVPLSEMIASYRASAERSRVDGPGPRARIAPNLRLRHCYDRPIWDYFDADGCVSVSTNSLGFRDLEFSAEKPPGELRILTVGDSFTFGSGVQLEDSWPQVLEALLEEDRGQPVEVINGGFAAGSHWPPGYVEWLESNGLALDPDIVIVGLCLNDLHHSIPMLGYPVRDDALKPWFGGASQLLWHIQRTWRQRELKARQVDFAEVLRQAPQEWEETQEALRTLRSLVARHGVRFIVAILPMVSQLGEHCPYAGLHELVVAFCAKERIDCVDLLPTVRYRDETDLWAHPTDQHPNDVANRLFAEGLYRYLTGKRD